MLRDLSCPSGQFLSLLFPAGIIVFHFDFLISGCLANSFQGQTSFLRLISSPSGNDHRIKHHHIAQAHIHDNNIFLHTDHICRHAHTCLPIRLQGIQQISSNRKIRLRCQLRGLS